MELLWLLIAFTLGFALSRVGLPPLVGYLATGFVMAGLKLEPGALLEPLAHLGVLLLLFTLGLTMDWRQFARREVAGAGFLHLVASTLFYAAVLLAFGVSAWMALLIAVALANPSSVVMGKSLESRGELRSLHGRLAVGISVFQDVFALTALVLVTARTPTPWALLLLGLPLLRPLLAALLTRVGHDELLLLLALALTLGLAETTHAVGLTPEIGALLAGALLAGHAQVHELERLLFGLRETFLVGFFVLIGLQGVPTLGQVGEALLLAALLPVKVVLLFALQRWTGLRARTSFLVAIALATYSEFTLVLASLAVEAGTLGPEMATTLSLAVAFTMLVASPLNRYVHALHARLDPYIHEERGSVRGQDVEPTHLGAARWLVMGMGRTGGAVYKFLDARGERVVGFDSDLAKVERHLKKGRRVLYADAEDPDLWKHLKLAQLQGVLLAMPDLEAKCSAIVAIKARGYTGLIAATSLHLEEDEPLTAAGATLIVHPYADAGERFAERTLEAWQRALPPVTPA